MYTSTKRKLLRLEIIFAKILIAMKTIYLSRLFTPVIVDTPFPGDVHLDNDKGECRRLTAKRFCLAAERMGRESESIVGLLEAIGGLAENGAYDGRPLDSWYGLVGLPPALHSPSLVPIQCPECNETHFSLKERGEVWNDGLCAWCWSRGWLAC